MTPDRVGTNGHERKRFAAGDGFTTDPTLPDLDRGNSTYDVRHRLTVSYLWELPFFLHRKGFVSATLAGWQLNGIWAFQSGAHWTPFDPRRSFDFQELAAGACEAGTFDPRQCVSEGGDYNLDGVSNDRPNALKDHVNATHPSGPTASIFPQIFSLRPAWHASATWGGTRLLVPDTGQAMCLSSRTSNWPNNFACSSVPRLSMC